MKNFIRSAEMIQDGVHPIASEIWNWAAKQGLSSLKKALPDKVYYTLLPHTTGRLNVSKEIGEIYQRLLTCVATPEVIEQHQRECAFKAGRY